MKQRQNIKAFYPLLVLLMVSGLMANVAAPRLFMGFNYLLGSIPVLLVLRLYGTGWGLLAGIIAGSWTYVLFGHPYAMVWLTAEPLFIGIVLNRTRINNLVLANTIYWALVGIPLLWFFFKFVMNLPFVGTLPAALMFWIIGITNSLIATIILQLTPLYRLARKHDESRLISIRQAIFSIMMALVMVPAIMVMIINGRAILNRNETSIIDKLHVAADNYSLSLHLILDPVRLLLKSGEMDVFPDSFFKSIGIIGIWTKGHDETASQRYWEYASAPDPTGLKSGQVVSDRLGIPDSVAVGDSQTSRLVLLRRDYMTGHLALMQKDKSNLWATLLDREGLIISTNNPNIADQKAYAPGDFGEPRTIQDGIYQILPPMPTYVTLWRRVQTSWYSFATTADEQLGWTWIIEIPFAPFQKDLLQQQAYALLTLLALCLATLVVSLKVSHRFSKSILGLTETTTGLADRVENDLPLAWPESRLEEVSLLTTNFKGMATALRARFKDLRHSHEMMGQNVHNRTAELHAAKEQAERVYRLVPSGLFAVDRECRIIIWNKKAEEITGYSASEALGQNCLIFSTEPCSTSCRLFDGSTMPADDIECTIRCKDGTKRIVAKNIDYLLDSSSNIIGGIESFEDVTEKKGLENKLRQSQKMEAVGLLAGGVAHDFNNMLGVIIGYAELILEQMPPSQQFHAELEEIKKAARRSSDLTRQLLTFARKQTVAPKVLDLNQTIEGMLNMLRRLIGENIELIWVPGTSLWLTKIDPSQVDQILANLCVNARDAIAGVGTITVETENSTFDEEYCASHVGSLSGEYVRIAFSDTGRGMDKETLAHIFEPFFTTKGVGNGTGLGLATVYGAVKQNNGFINVYSEPEKGTTFAIYIPRHVAKATTQTHTTDSVKPVLGGNEIILLVEDEPTILNMSRKILERLGYTVLAAGTPNEAIRLANEFSGMIHLLATDVIMPEMNGRQLAERLMESRPEMKSLYMSGYTANIIANQGVLKEGVSFIQKPFSKNELAAKVREALES